jgi:hypothetical protein
VRDQSARLAKQLIYQRGLAMVNMGNDGNITQGINRRVHLEFPEEIRTDRCGGAL